MECPHIPSTSYRAFSKRLHEKAGGQRMPLTGSLEVTARCNLCCAHCYINLPANDRAALEKELSRVEMCDILDQIADEGCLWLLLTGGEPFIRLDFLDIYAHAKKKGFLITLFTNGTTITPRIADFLAEWRPFAIEVTLYGRTRETYERVTGVPGSYRRCMQGIELLVERKLPLKLKSMIMTLNCREVWEMKTFAENLGVDFRFDPVLNLRLDGDSKPAAVRIPPEQVVALDLADSQRMEEWREFSAKFWGPPSRSEHLYNCGAGVGTFHIDPLGQMSPCIMSRVPSYGLRQGTFRQGWHDFMPQVLAQKQTRSTECQQCDLFALCGQCPGWARTETGDQEERVQYLCQIAHLRAEAFGLSNQRVGEQ